MRLCVILYSLPVPRSLAVTFRMPLASMSKVTSICGTPLGAGGKSTRLNMPSDTLSAAIGSFALEYVDGDCGLEVCGCCEDLAAFGGDGGVFVHDFGEYAAHGFNTKGERGNVK